MPESKKIPLKIHYWQVTVAEGSTIELVTLLTTHGKHNDQGKLTTVGKSMCKHQRMLIRV